ncbi:MAG TPA: MlaD family protein [Blastocatellia bacterium]|nr:MlaD family protein [Blastocatellia bacterium]
MARTKTTLSELKVGLLAVGAITILIIFILSVSGDISLFKRTLHYRTRFAAAEGLKNGDEVRLAGKLVGKIENVEFAGIPSSKDEKPIIVTMTVDAREVQDRIRTDSQSVLAQQGFLGDHVVDISVGTRNAEVLPDGGEIPSADQAGLAQVFSGANDILVQFNSVGKALQEVMDNINQGKGTVGKLLHDDEFYTNLNRTALEFQQLGAKVNKGEGTIGKLINDPKLYDDLRTSISDVQGIVSDARAGKGTLGKLITDDQLYRQANDIVAKLNSTAEKFDRIVADVEAGKGTVGKLIKSEKLHEDVQATVASIRSISDRLDKGEGSAGKLLRDEQLYNNLNQTTAELVKLLYDFRQDPKKYLRIRVSLF